MTSSRDIALFGGSFDPPHLGHVAIIAHVLATEAIDEVWVLPCFQHAFGKRMAPFELRLRMLEAVVAPFGGRARVEDIEASLGGVSYTIDTVRALALQHPDARFAFVGGGDLRAELPKWKEPEALQALLRWIELPRRGVARSYDDPPYLLPEVSSSELRARAARGESVATWVPRGVADLLAQEMPYRRGPGE